MSVARRGFRIAGRLIKLAFILIIAAVNILFLWRIFSSSDPRSMNMLQPNAALAEAYAADNALSDAFYQDQRTLTSSEENYGYFGVTRTAFIPSANQAQLTFRYNNSTIRATQKDYALPQTPARTDELYDVTLLVAVDLTPENKDDNLSDSPEAVAYHRVHGRCVAQDQKNVYNYRKLVFDFGELDLGALKRDGLLIAIYADVYYVGDINYDEKPYGTLCLYDYLSADLPVKVSSADKAAIEEWKESNS